MASKAATRRATGLTRRGFAAAAGLIAAGLHIARAEAPVRVGALHFGSLNWELDVIARHGFDRAAAVTLTVVEFASSQAAETALLAGSVDVIVQDWLWAARQRQAGGDLAFAALSNATGAVMLPPDSTITTLKALAGKRLGVAGSPIDKSWIILRAYGQAHDGIDLAAITEPSYGPPPLLDQQMRAGRLDAALTYWPFAAREEAAGLRTLISMEAALASLGFDSETPVVGHVFSTAWARANARPLAGLLAASAQARGLLARDDGEWQAIAKLTGAADERELARLRAHYRAGMPSGGIAAQKARAARLYALLVKTSGVKLLGAGTTLDERVFWQPDPA